MKSKIKRLKKYLPLQSYNMTGNIFLYFRICLGRVELDGMDSPGQDRWLHRAYRQCSAPPQMGTCAEHVPHGNEGRGDPSQMDSWWWLAPWTGNSWSSPNLKEDDVLVSVTAETALNLEPCVLLFFLFMFLLINSLWALCMFCSTIILLNWIFYSKHVALHLLPLCVYVNMFHSIPQDKNMQTDNWCLNVLASCPGAPLPCASRERHPGHRKTDYGWMDGQAVGLNVVNVDVAHSYLCQA